jgi:hypothetical protein
MGFGYRAFSFMVFLVKSATLAFECMKAEDFEVGCLALIAFEVKVWWR